MSSTEEVIDARHDEDKTLSADVLPSEGRQGSVIGSDYLVLDYGTDWILRVSPAAWKGGRPRAADVGSLLTVEGDEGLSILVFNHSRELYQLNLDTWILAPFSGHECLKAKRWNLAMTSPASVETWSLPTVDAEVA